MRYQKIWTNRLQQLIVNTASKIQPLFESEKRKIEYAKGAGGDITLEIDKKAEEFVIQGLKSYNEEFLLISEEVGYYYWNPNENKIIYDINLIPKKCPNFFILDPIDGSRNAKHGIPFYCISLAYSKSLKIKDIEIGIVYNFLNKDFYIAEKHHGSFKNNQKIYCSKTDSLGKALVGTELNFKTLISENSNISIINKKILNVVHKVRIFGASALEMCLVAQGALDLFYNLRGNTRIVDIAAGILIVQEAGGKIYNSKFGFISEESMSLNQRYSIFASNESIMDTLKSIL